MTTEDLLTAVREGNMNEEVVSVLADFFDLTDPYGILDYYGDYSKRSVKRKVMKEVRYEFTEEPALLIERLEFDLNEAGNYDFDLNRYIN